MGRTSSISWTDGSYNPWRGCERVSEGCKNCYAEEQSHRNPKVLGSWGKQKPRVVAAQSYWDGVPRLLSKDAHDQGKRKRLFCLSFGDFFEQFDGPMNDHKGQRLFVNPSGQWVPQNILMAGSAILPLTMDDVRERVLGQIARTPLLDWLFLTKRSEHILATLRRIANSPDSFCEEGRALARNWVSGKPPENVWLGASVENQDRAAHQIESLKAVPATVRFLSVEPMLGPIDVSPWLDPLSERAGGFSFYRHSPECQGHCDYACLEKGDILSVPDPDAFHWVIIGGESGGSARPFDVDAARALKDQLELHGVPTFVKQMGAKPVASDPADQRIVLKMTHDKGEDIWEWPSDLQVQEFPNTEE